MQVNVGAKRKLTPDPPPDASEGGGTPLVSESDSGRTGTPALSSIFGGGVLRVRLLISSNPQPGCLVATLLVDTRDPVPWQRWEHGEKSSREGRQGDLRRNASRCWLASMP